MAKIDKSKLIPPRDIEGAMNSDNKLSQKGDSELVNLSFKVSKSVRKRFKGAALNRDMKQKDYLIYLLDLDR